MPEPTTSAGIGALDTLDPDRVAPLLRGRFGSPYLYVPSCESTQQLLTADLPEGSVAVTEHQRDGRGRLGRVWEAPAGRAILCSILLRPPPKRLAQQLSLIGGIAVALAVEHALGRPCGLKWPNDVLVGDGKIAGLLAEARGDQVVLGFGINVNQSVGELPALPVRSATSLFVTDGVRRDRASLLADVLRELERLYDAWIGGGFSAVAPELSTRDVLRGRSVTVAGRRGTAVGIAEDGQLELQLGAERLLVSSGDVSYEG